MKKLLLLILIFAYAVSSSGATVYFHYCMGKMVEWSVTSREKEKCANCGMEKDHQQKNDCCKDEYQQIKTNHDQLSSEVYFQTLQINSDALIAHPYTSAFLHDALLAGLFPSGHEPPRSNGSLLYKRLCVFRI